MTQNKNIPDLFQKYKGNETVLRQTEMLSQKSKDILLGLKDVYVAQLKKDVLLMQEALKKAETLSLAEQLSYLQGDFFVKMHDLKGQGSTFGYDSLSQIGRCICQILRQKKITSSDFLLCQKAVADITLVLQEKSEDEILAYWKEKNG